MNLSNIYKTSGSIPSNEQLPLRYDLYVPDGGNREHLPVVLFLHGFKGFKDWGPFPDACEELSRLGFVVISFNFSLNGVGDGLLEFDRPDLFERQTLSQDLEDVGSVIEAVKSRTITSSRVGLNSDLFAIVGYSRGGHTAVAAAAEFTEVQCLVTWSAVADYNTRWSEQMVRDWNEKGFTEIRNARTGEVLPLGKAIYEDAQEHARRLAAVNRVRELHLPALFIAGREDETVSWKDSEALYRNCPSPAKELRVVGQAGHTFGASHPFEEEDFPEPFREVLELTGDWLQVHLL